MDDLRNFKRAQLPHPDHDEEGHTDMVYTIQLQDDYLVSGSKDKSIRRWDVLQQRLIGAPLLGHEASVLCLQYDASPEEDIIISGGTDNAIIVWQFSTGEIIRKIANAHSESVLSLVWDDRYLVTGSKDKTVKIWIRQTVSAQDEVIPQFVRSAPPILEQDLMITEYNHLATLERHRAAVNAVQLNGDKILSGAGDRLLHVWSLHSGEVTHTFNLHNSGIACLWQNSRFAVTGSTDRTVKVIDLEQKHELACLEGHQNLVRSLQVMEDTGGEPLMIVTGSYNGCIKYWKKNPSSRVWHMEAEFKFGSLQPLTKSGELRDQNPLARAAEQPSRAFKVQTGKGRLFCSGEGRIIEGWEFEAKPSTT